jgi:hypothetical protein
MREDISWDPTSLVTDSNDHMLWCLTDRHLNWWRFLIPSSGMCLLTLDDGLDAVSQQLADDVF